MPIFRNQEIDEIQTWKTWKNLKFDADASPAAWEHYKRYYSETFEEYDIRFPTFCSYVVLNRYIPRPLNPDSNKYWRLFALLKGTELLRDKEGEYYPAVPRLSGETDFNFIGKNCKHYYALKSILKEGNEQEYLEKLEECKKQHHCLLNFSLMQTMGNMQGFKGKHDDRLDRFIYYLDKYYKEDKSKRIDTEIIGYSSEPNRPYLLKYLNQFKDIKDYCKKVYFISNKKLIDKLIALGQVEQLDTAEKVKTYVDLAFWFWNEKEFYFSKNEYDTVGSYFPDGGETYTGEELSCKLMNDLGVDQEEIGVIIEKCLNRGFIHQCGNNCYVR